MCRPRKRKRSAAPAGHGAAHGRPPHADHHHQRVPVPGGCWAAACAPQGPGCHTPAACPPLPPRRRTPLCLLPRPNVTPCCRLCTTSSWSSLGAISPYERWVLAHIARECQHPLSARCCCHAVFAAAAATCGTLGSRPPSPEPQVPVGKQHENYNHPLIHIYLLKRRKQPLGAEAEAGSEAGSTEAGEGAAAVTEAGEGAAAVTEAGEGAAAVTEAGEGAAAVTEAGDGAAAVAAAGEGAAAAAGGGAALPGEVESARLAEADAAAAAGGGSEGDEEPPSPPAGGEAASGDKHADQFQTRRMGVMLAKSLKHVTI